MAKQSWKGSAQLSPVPCVLVSSGIIDALREKGIQEGDIVSIYDFEFEFVN